MYYDTFLLGLGIRLVEQYMTDSNEARALSYARDVIDIYSNSWGPNDEGKTIGGPEALTSIALEEGVSKVS